MALDGYFHNKIEALELEIVERNSKLRRLEAQRNDYNSRGAVYLNCGLLHWRHQTNKHIVRLLREELGLLQQPGSYVGEVVKVMGSKRVLVKVHPEGKYGKYSNRSCIQ
jgi:26S proteasome regulatory subunit T6